MAKPDAPQQAYLDSLKAMVADDPAMVEALDALAKTQIGETCPPTPPVTLPPSRRTRLGRSLLKRPHL